MKTSLRHALTLAGTALALSGTAAAAQDTANDARCFFVSNLFSKSTDPKAKQFAINASFYYLGRLTALGSLPQVERQLKAVGPSVTRQNADATMTTCARAVVENARQVREIGQRLQQQQGPHK